MTDDNVIRLVHEVASLNEDHNRPQRMGTLLTLEKQPLTAGLWDPKFVPVPLGPAAPVEETAEERDVRMTRPGRELKLFLDRVAMLASRDSAHLLDRRYADLLDECERALARQLVEAADSIRRLSGTTRRAREWQEVLTQLDRWGGQSR